MKAIVVETRKNEAAVLLKDGTFRVIKGRYTVGETIEYRRRVRPAVVRWMAAAAVLILMLGTGGGFWYDANYVVYGEVSLDTDSSIVYTVNKRNKVLGVRAVSDDAVRIVDTLQQEHIRFMPVSEAIERTFAIMETDSEDGGYVLINVSSDNAGLQDRLEEAVETGMGPAREHDPSMEVRIERSDRATARLADENGMSPGRYAAWERSGNGGNPEEFGKKPIREIMMEEQNRGEGVNGMPEEGGGPAEGGPSAGREAIPPGPPKV